MKSKKLKLAEPADVRIDNKIYYIRGKKVMLDRDLAELYGVETRVLNQAVLRNRSRFPSDFMFQLNTQETKVWLPRLEISRSQFATLDNKILKSQFVISKDGRGGSRTKPYAFTEQGVAMLSSVLNSERAVQVNIQIMRTFTKIREMIATNSDLRQKLEKLEKKYDHQFRIVFDAIKNLLAAPMPTRPAPYNDKNIVTFNW